MRWPEKNYVVSERLGLLYVPIEKVACSAIKKWLIENEEGKDVAQRVDPHEHVRARYELRNLSLLQARRRLRNRRLVRFAFVRNPWDRLVSAFVNKFVSWKSPADRFVSDVSRLQRRMRFVRRATLNLHGNDFSKFDASSINHSLSFRQFVDLLQMISPGNFDYHWRPQTMFLRSHTPDFLGRFENLAIDFRQLCDRIGVVGELPIANRTDRRSETPGCLADWTLEQLRSLERFPRYDAFYAPEIVDQVGTIYATDIRAFEYQFLPCETKTAAAIGPAAANKDDNRP